MFDGVLSEEGLRWIEMVSITGVVVLCGYSVVHTIVHNYRDQKEKNDMLRGIYEATVKTNRGNEVSSNEYGPQKVYSYNNNSRVKCDSLNSYPSNYYHLSNDYPVKSRISCDSPVQ